MMTVNNDDSATEVQVDSPIDTDAVLFEKSMERFEVQQEKQQNVNLRAELTRLHQQVDVL